MHIYGIIYLVVVYDPFIFIYPISLPIILIISPMVVFDSDVPGVADKAYGIIFKCDENQIHSPS